MKGKVKKLGGYLIINWVTLMSLWENSVPNLVRIPSDANTVLGWIFLVLMSVWLCFSKYLL